MSSSLLLSAAIPISLGYASSIPTRKGIDSFLDSLNKPIRHPPSWVFAAFASIFYLIIGYASFIIASDLVYESDPGRVTTAKLGLSLYWFQVVVSLGYGPVFFGLERIDIAGLVMGTDSIIALITTVCFFRIQWLAGLLMLLFWAWTVFASYYTFRLWSLNRGSHYGTNHHGALYLHNEDENEDDVDNLENGGSESHTASRLVEVTSQQDQD